MIFPKQQLPPDVSDKKCKKWSPVAAEHSHAIPFYKPVDLGYMTLPYDLLEVLI